MFTFQVHSSLKAFPEAARRAVLSSDLVDDAVVSPGTQVVVLACNTQSKEGEEEEREKEYRFYFIVNLYDTSHAGQV